MNDKHKENDCPHCQLVDNLAKSIYQLLECSHATEALNDGDAMTILELVTAHILANNYTEKGLKPIMKEFVDNVLSTAAEVKKLNKINEAIDESASSTSH